MYLYGLIFQFPFTDIIDNNIIIVSDVAIVIEPVCDLVVSISSGKEMTNSPDLNRSTGEI